MYKIIIILLLILCFHSSIAQCLSKKNQIKQKISLNHMLFLVDQDIENVNLEFAINYGKGLDLYSGACMLDLDEIVKMDIKFPRANIVLYRYINNHFDYLCNNFRVPIFNHSQMQFVIGLDTISNVVIFIDGPFHRSGISHSFKLDASDPYSSNFADYIFIKLSTYELVDIQFVEKTRDELIYKAYSKGYKGWSKIFIDKNDFDNIKIIGY